MVKISGIQNSINVTHYINRIKNKDHMRISTDTEKNIWKNSTALHDKNHSTN